MGRKLGRSGSGGKGDGGVGKVNLVGNLRRSAERVGWGDYGADGEEGEVEDGDVEPRRGDEERDVAPGETGSRAEGGGEVPDAREEVWVGDGGSGGGVD